MKLPVGAVVREFTKAVEEFLVGKLSYDKQLQDLLMYASSESYLTLKYTR